MIVRNEAKFLGDCLRSLQSIADEVIVVDTGSTDETPAIAAAHGAVVRHFQWCDDFAAARNAALDAASGEWILYIDADEQLQPVERTAVEALLRRTDALAFRLLLRPSPRATPYREYRLWRNDPRIRFDGVIHEKVVPAIHAVADSDGRGILPCDLELVHFGYEGDQTRKHLRNLPLLRRQLEVDPDNLFVWHHLSRVLEGLGDASEAERVLERGLQVARAKPWRDPLAVLLYADLVRMREHDGDHGYGEALLAEGLELYGDNCVLLWLHSRALIRRGAYEEALVPLDRILAFDPAQLPDLGPSYDEQLIHEFSHDARGLCLFRLGRYTEATQEYAAAAQWAPENPAYGAKLAIARARGGRAVDASLTVAVGARHGN
ncbi:glycosyltransferase [Pseudonocardia sp. CA-142604]|uniref:glycosyltransferase n=1 Tax=Pseudonocardia sp. CA-142604 TaxID=3240024 RepID=UPI003D8ABC81